MKHFHIILACIVLMAAAETHAQKDSSSKEPGSGLRLGTYYTSALHYYGRTDSLRSSGFFPLAEFWAGEHFYLTAAPVFVINDAAGFQYTGTVATAGLRFRKEKKYMANLYVVKPLYKENSELVQSALQWQAVGTYTWLNAVLNLTVGTDIKISDKTDFGATVVVDHLIRKEFKKGKVFLLDPSVALNAGTQQFTKTSYKRGGFLLLPGVGQTINEEVKQFKILSYEASMPVIFIVRKWQLLVNPAYVLPQNLVKVPNRPDLSERGREMFYVTAGLKYSF